MCWMLCMGYSKPGGDYHMVDPYAGWNARAGGGLYLIRAHLMATYPLSEHYYLANYREDLILLDRFGNRELVCPKSRLPGPADKLVHPVPFRPRTRPPVIPAATYQGERAVAGAPAATISVMNVYEGDMKLPEGAKIMWLRVIQI